MFIDKVVSLFFGLAFLFALSCDGPSSDSAVQQDRAAGKNKPLHNDPVFWDYAASSNMLQTELGQLATEKGESDSLKAMGAKTVKFHSRALKQLRSVVAGQENIQLPDSLGSADRSLVQEFKLLAGEEFNTRYRDFIVNSHKMQLTRYQEALGRAENQKMREWLHSMLDHLRKELDSVMKSDSLAQQ